MTPHIPTANEVETFTGGYVNTAAPQPETIKLEDIAHALSQVCRYGGHCQRFYSVAEHAVFVSRRLERQGASLPLQFGGLHHDDAEAFLGDIPRPIKPLLGAAYKRLTAKMDTAIFRAVLLGCVHGYTLDDIHRGPVKSADNWALFVEARHLLPSQGRHWWDGDQGAAAWGLPDKPSRIVTPDYWLGGLLPHEARDLYLARHKELTES